MEKYVELGEAHFGQDLVLSLFLQLKTGSVCVITTFHMLGFDMRGLNLNILELIVCFKEEGFPFVASVVQLVHYPSVGI